MQIDYQEYLDQIEQAKSDYTTMVNEETDENRQNYYRGILAGLEEASGLLAEILESLNKESCKCQ